MSVVVVELPADQDQQVAEEELLVQGLTRLDSEYLEGLVDNWLSSAKTD